MGIKISKLFFASFLSLLAFFNLFVASASAQTATPGACTNTVPSSAPNLYQVTSASSSATLYFAPPSSGFNGFTISYGLDNTASAYNVSFSQGPTSGAVTYTVNALTPNSTYYFKVRANNGCAPGPWSNVLASNQSSPISGTPPSGSPTTSTPSTGNVTTPVTGPEDVVFLGLGALLLSAFGIGVFVKNK